MSRIAPGGRNHRLDGWKAIADYFDITERAAQTWEKERRLPVHRLGGRVHAFELELEVWKREQDYSLVSARPEPRLEESQVAPTSIAVPPFDVPPDKQSPNFNQRKLWFAIGILVSLACLAGWVWYRQLRLSRQPVSWRLEERLLTVRDQDNAVLWTHHFPYSSPRVQTGHPEDKASEISLFVDLDGDGRFEFLHSDSESGGSAPLKHSLYCFNDRGEVVWRYWINGRRAITTGLGQQLSGDFDPRIVRVLARARPDGGRIVIGGTRGEGSLFKLEILRADGSPVAGYFHPGWLDKVLITDLDGDSWEEIILGGVNNSFAAATLVVLDSRMVDGQGPIRTANDPRRVAAVPDGSERAVLLFPDLAPYADPHAYYRVNQLRREGLSGVRVQVFNGGHLVYAGYEFDSQLRIQNITPSLDLQTVLFRDWPDASDPAAQQAAVANKLMKVRFLKNDFVR